MTAIDSHSFVPFVYTEPFPTQDANQMPIVKSSPEYSKKVEDAVKEDLTAFLYDQYPVGILAELVVAVFASVALWGVSGPKQVLVWLVYLFVFSFCGRVLLLHLFRSDQHRFSKVTWLRLYTLGAFFSAIAWGFFGGVLMPEEGLVYQTFVVFILLGVVSAANNLYSANPGVYAVFLITAMLPVTFWIFSHGGLYVFIGMSAILYMLTMLVISKNNFGLLRNVMTLGYKNIDLDLLNQLLERQVNERTRDLNHSLALIQTTLESIDYGLVVVNLEDEVTYYNYEFLSIWDLDQIELQRPLTKKNRTCILNLQSDPEQFLLGDEESKKNPELEHFDELRLRDGRVLERFIKPHTMNDKIIGRVYGYRDITHKKNLELSIVHQAQHDSLTQLPNRTLLRDRIEHDIEIANRFNSFLAVMFLDIDHFKDINDALGHQKGDELLQHIANRLGDCVRKSDTVARFGGDEFIILFLTKVEKEMTDLCQKILATVAKPIALDKDEIHVTASIGLSIYPRDGTDSDALIRNADMAMYLAKKAGRNHFEIYNRHLTVQAKRQHEIQQQLLGAVGRGEFRLVYQPIIQLSSNAIVGFEALARWRNPLLGEVLPNEFIPTAEDMGVIFDLSKWVITQACFQNKRLQEEGIFVRMAVNVSSVQLKRGNLVAEIHRILDEAQLDPIYLEIELTETTLMDSSKSIVHLLEELRSKNIGVSIDDFGTGYSSFRYLTEFPASSLKIDKSLVQHCEHNEKSISVIKAIVNMSHQLGLRVVAEGVETKNQLALIQEAGCDELQGYLFSPPVPPEEMVGLFAG
jgi:diguanylate cyclase (GGDEF)-like protein